MVHSIQKTEWSQGHDFPKVQKERGWILPSGLCSPLFTVEKCVYFKKKQKSQQEDPI